jgi:vancomycin resistance protein YoaR
LVMKAYQPETRTEYKMRRGIPQPKEVRKDRDHKHVRFSIVVSDWVTGHQVWQAEIMDRKPKRNAEAAPDEDAEIDTRGLSTEQIAQAIIRELRRYVDHLASQQGTH